MATSDSPPPQPAEPQRAFRRAQISWLLAFSLMLVGLLLLTQTLDWPTPLAISVPVALMGIFMIGLGRYLRRQLIVPDNHQSLDFLQLTRAVAGLGAFILAAAVGLLFLL